MSVPSLKRRPLIDIARVSALVLILGATASALPTGRNRGRGAPEIDPGLASAGVALIVGGTLILTGRRRVTKD